MELKHYYRLTFTNGQEFFVESDIEDRHVFLKTLGNEGLFSKTGFVSLQLKDTDPLDLRSDKLFSVQRAHKGMIGAQTKVWRIVE